uniref:RING-type domain-containing protein n=1 Tax=Macrostomum lignano TaxID=282301 RepID=A0A1I8JN89_9PLAT
TGISASIIVTPPRAGAAGVPSFGKPLTLPFDRAGAAMCTLKAADGTLLVHPDMQGGMGNSEATVENLAENAALGGHRRARLLEARPRIRTTVLLAQKDIPDAANWDENPGRWLLQIWDRVGGVAADAVVTEASVQFLGSSGARLPPRLALGQEVLHSELATLSRRLHNALVAKWQRTACGGGDLTAIVNEARRVSNRIFMEAAGGDTGKFNCRTQPDRLRVRCEGKRNGGETSEIRVRCDCPPQTLLATLAHSLVEALLLRSGGRGLDNAELEIESAEEPYRPVLLAQIGECRHQIRSARNVAHGGVAASLQLISGRIFLAGDILLVSEPVRAASRYGGPHISGAMAQRSDLFACVADDLDGACLFYDAERSLLQLGSSSPFCSGRCCTWAASFVWTFWPASCPTWTDSPAQPATRTCPAPRRVSCGVRLTEVLGSAAVNETTARTAQGSLNLDVATNSQSGGRCLLHNDTIVVLSGLLHFVGSWYRVQTACSGSGFQAELILHAPCPNRTQSIPRISGSSMLKRQRKKPSTVRRHNGEEAEAARNVAEAASALRATGGDRPLLLNNVWLYTQGGTVFIGGSALLTEAQLAMSADFKPVPLDQQERLLASLPSSTRRQVPCRLFLQ